MAEKSSTSNNLFGIPRIAS